MNRVRFSLRFLFIIVCVFAIVFFWMGPVPTQLELDLRNELSLPDTNVLTVISHSTNGRERVTAVTFDGEHYQLFVAYRDFMRLRRFPQLRLDEKWWIPRVTPGRDDGSLILPSPQDITEFSKRFTAYPTEYEIAEFRGLFDDP